MTIPVNQVNFAIARIATLQFATFEEELPKDNDVQLSTILNFGLGANERAIRIKGTFQFEAHGNVFIKLEVYCEFAIEQQAWQSFIQDDTQFIIFPKGLMTHLATLLVGTSRGILHCKTENSVYNRFILSTINVAEMVTDDIQMDLLLPTVQQ